MGDTFVLKEQKKSSVVFRYKTGKNTNSFLPSAGELCNLDLIVLMKS